MHEYYVNKNADSIGKHVVHRFGCKLISLPEQFVKVGSFSSYYQALKEALKLYTAAEVCQSCLDQDKQL
jgi:hypothetical protein